MRYFLERWHDQDALSSAHHQVKINCFRLNPTEMEQQLYVQAGPSLDPVGYLKSFTSQNVRPDGRPLHSARPTSIVSNIISRNSYGSSLVRIGSTQVLTAATLYVGNPSVSYPKRGELDLHLHFSPICSSRYSLGGRLAHSEEVVIGNTSCKLPTSSNNTKVSTALSTLSALSCADPQATESYIKRTIQSSNIINLEDLCIQEGKSAWKIQLTCIVLNHDGNVVDAAILACVAALADLHIPQTKIVTDAITGQSIVRIWTPKSAPPGQERKDRHSIQLYSLPVAVTFVLFEGKWLVDPILAEEAVCDGLITIVVDAANIQRSTDHFEGPIISLQKLGGGKLTSMESLVACTQIALGRAHELKGLFESLVPKSKDGL